MWFDIGLSTDPQCVGCGGALPPGEGRPKVQCPYCGRLQLHPQPIALGHEVLVRGEGRGMELGVVEHSTGPDAIRLGDGRTVRLRMLVPVIAAVGVGEPGMPAYARGPSGSFYPTRIVEIDAASCTVKDEHRSFQDSFFDDQLLVEQVWVHADPTRRVSLSWPARIVQRIKDDPMDFVFKVPFYAVGAFFAFVFLAIAVQLVRALVFG